MRTFVRAHDENLKQIELEKKKAQKEAENENMKASTPKKGAETEKMKTSGSQKRTFKWENGKQFLPKGTRRQWLPSRIVTSINQGPSTIYLIDQQTRVSWNSRLMYIYN